MVKRDERDVVDDRAEGALLGILQVAAAVRACPTIDPPARELAGAVLGIVAVQGVGNPAEAGALAFTFNRQMDAVLDAANESHDKRERSTRRQMMAAAIDAAGLVLLDRGELATLIADRIAAEERAAELALRRAPVPGCSLIDAMERRASSFAGFDLAPIGLGCVDFIEQEPGLPACSNVND